MSIAQKGYIPTADSIAEDAIIELGEAQEFLWEVWEQYFSGISEPAGWSTNYQKIQRTITVYKFLMDRIVDDGSAKMKPSRYIALIAPICATLLYIPNCIIEDVPTQTKVVYAIVWIPAVIAVYFNLKHAIIPNMDFGFIKAIKPYNIFALLLCFSELLCLTAWDYYYPIQMAIASILFGALCICAMIAAKKGVAKWAI